MSVSDFSTDDRFVVRVVKHLITNPGDAWANSYEFVALDAGAETELLALATGLVTFEASFHYTTTIFDRVLISTWEADSVPYDPASFISSTLSAIGDTEATTDPLALNQCLSVSRSAAFGRFGHLFYRNCVSEGDVQAPAGKLILNSRPTFQERIDDALSDSGLEGYIGIPPSLGLQMVMINADGTQVRPIVQLRVQGMTTVKTDHKWFNRTTP